MTLIQTGPSDSYWVTLLLWDGREEKSPLYLIEIPVEVVRGGSKVTAVIHSDCQMAGIQMKSDSRDQSCLEKIFIYISFLYTVRLSRE